MFGASIKLKMFHWCFPFKLILHLAMLVHQNRRQKIFYRGALRLCRGAWRFVQGSLNATTLFIY